MKISRLEAESVIQLLMIPAIEKAGVKRKSECKSSFKLMRYDDLTPPLINDNSIKLKLDIKKSMQKMYTYMLEFRLYQSGQLGLYVDLSNGPIQNHHKAMKKLAVIVSEFQKLLDQKQTLRA